MAGTAQGGGGFIILCSTQSNTGPLNREQRWRIILGAFSPPPPRSSSSSPALSISLRLFFPGCMSAIHLSAVSASETSTGLSLHVTPAFGGPCSAAADLPYGSSGGPRLKPKRTASLAPVGSKPAVNIGEDGWQRPRRSRSFPESVSFTKNSIKASWFPVSFGHQSIKSLFFLKYRQWRGIVPTKETAPTRIDRGSHRGTVTG